MQENQNNDPLISALLQKSLLEIPFSDFEETVMLRIQHETLFEKRILRDRKLSFLFFIAGTCLGLILNTILQRSKFTLPNIAHETTLLFFQTSFVLLVVLQLDRSFSLLKQWRKYQ